jgi:hypothetical protein
VVSVANANEEDANEEGQIDAVQIVVIGCTWSGHDPLHKTVKYRKLAISSRKLPLVIH